MMALSKEATNRLNNYQASGGIGGKSSHTGHDSDFSQFIRIVVDRYRTGELLHPDDVRDVALTWGWDEDAAWQLGHDADVVVYTLKVVEPRRH
jgi:hypothetical protein